MSTPRWAQWAHTGLCPGFVATPPPWPVPPLPGRLARPLQAPGPSVRPPWPYPIQLYHSVCMELCWQHLGHQLDIIGSPVILKCRLLRGMLGGIILPHVGTQWRSSGQSFVHRTNSAFIGTLLLPTLILAPLEGPSAFIRSLLGTPYGTCWISHGFVGLHKLT